MKLANPTLTQGRLAWVFAVAGLSLVGCDSGSDGATTGTEAAGDDDDDGDDDDGTSTGEDTESETNDTEPTTESADTSTGEETTGPPPEGLGCDPAPPCDRGELVGSIRIETADQIADIAGYTSMTGWLEVVRSDLTCLNFLSCMESVGHDVSIFGNEYLTDVSGLDGLTTLGASTADSPADEKDGTLVIAENTILEDINGVNSLQQTQISLNIAENPALTTISGFQSFVGTQKDFTLRFNESLSSVDEGGLREILFIGGECTVTNNTDLCITEIVDMCETGVMQGPAGGNTANNNEGC